MFKNITGRKIRIAIIGCGRISRNHFDSIGQHAELMELAAICDTDPDTLRKHEDLFKVPGFDRMEDMLQQEKIDVVALCTPSGFHPYQTILAAKHGVHVVAEKPMATRWQDAQNMVKACDDAGVRLFVVKQNRRNPTLQILKTAIEEKRFGRIYMVSINVFWTRSQAYYDSAKWRDRKSVV